jgi:hypothetical protein
MVPVTHHLAGQGTWKSNSPVLFVTCIFAVTVAAGCLVAPVPMTKRVQGYSGQPINNAADVKFVRVGETKREDVLQNFHWADSGIKDGRLFWGRWITSGSGVVWGVGGLGGGTSGEGSVSRQWVAHNLFVRFDEHGIVSQVHEVPDGEIVSQLAAFMLNEARDLDISTPIELQGKHRKSHSIGDIVVHLRLDSVRVDHSYGSKHNFQVSPDKIQRLTTSDTGDPVFTQVHLHLTEKTPAGSDPSFDLRPPELFVFASYLRKVQPSALERAAPGAKP